MSLKFELMRRNMVMVPTLDLYIWIRKLYNPESREDVSEIIKEFGLEKIIQGYEEGYTNLKIVNQKKFAFSVIKHGFEVN